MSRSESVRLNEERMRPKLTSVIAGLGIVTLVAVVWIGLAAAVARGQTATNVTFKHDSFFRPEARVPWPTDCYGDRTCSQRVQLELLDRSGGYEPPRTVHPYQSVDLGAVEDFQLTDTYATRSRSFSYFYFVSARGGDGPLTLTLTELHEGKYPSAFRVDVRCRRWTPSTGSEPVSCTNGRAQSQPDRAPDTARS